MKRKAIALLVVFLWMYGLGSAINALTPIITPHVGDFLHYFFGYEGSVSHWVVYGATLGSALASLNPFVWAMEVLHFRRGNRTYR